MKTKLFLAALAAVFSFTITANAQNIALKCETAPEYHKNSALFWYQRVDGKDADGIADYFKSNKITDAQVESLSIRSLRHSFLKAAPAENIMAGEVLSDTDKGKVILIHAFSGKPDEYGRSFIYDYIVTYDKSGKYVDSKLIGRRMISDNYQDPEIKFWVEKNIIITDETMGGESEIGNYVVNQSMKIVEKK